MRVYVITDCAAWEACGKYSLGMKRDFAFFFSSLCALQRQWEEQAWLHFPCAVQWIVFFYFRAIRGVKHKAERMFPEEEQGMLLSRKGSPEKVEWWLETLSGGFEQFVRSTIFPLCTRTLIKSLEVMWGIRAFIIQWAVWVFRFVFYVFTGLGHRQENEDNRIKRSD